MRIKILFLIAVLALLAVAAKYSAEVVFPDGQAGIVEASTKSGRSPYTTCRYFAPDYAEYLGRYDAPEAAPAPIAFCVSNYEHRVLD